MSYRPNPETLAARVIGFFALNPDEELTVSDVIEKFVGPGDTRNVHTQLMAALDHDMLLWDSDDEVYRKGPIDMPPGRGEPFGKRGRPAEATRVARAAVDATVAVLEAVASKSSAAALEEAQRLEMRREELRQEAERIQAEPAESPAAGAIDLLAVQVEHGIPIPPKPTRSVWRPFFDRLQPGDSVALPIKLKDRVSTAAKTENKAGRGSYTMRTLPDGELFRIWRVE